MQAGIYIYRLDGHDNIILYMAYMLPPKSLGKGSERVLTMPQQKASHVLTHLFMFVRLSPEESLTVLLEVAG